MGGEFLARTLVLLGVEEVVVPVRQAQRHHAQHELMPVRVAAVGADVESEGARGIVELGAAEGVNELLHVRDRVDRRQTRQQGTDAKLVEPAGVHVAQEVIVDLLLDRALGGLHVRQVFDDAAHALVGTVGQHRKRAVVTAIGRQFETVEPETVGETEEIVAGPHRRILVAQVDAEGAKFGRGAGGGLRRRRFGRRSGVAGRRGGLLRATGSQQQCREKQRQQTAAQVGRSRKSHDISLKENSGGSIPNYVVGRTKCQFTTDYCQISS